MSITRIWLTSIWAAPPQARGLLLPMGGGYADVLAGFAQALFAQADASVGKPACLKLVVLPTAYSSDPGRITDAERARNLHDAARRCRQIEEACNRAAPAGLTCTAVVAPIFTRADAADPAKYAPLTGDVSAVFMLGGDQTVAMAALAGTPAEAALSAAHARGALIAGTSAGGGMLSAHMLGGYHPTYAAANSLDVGAADVWNTDACRGLSFGAHGVLIDQHFFQRGRLGRLLNAIVAPGAVAWETPTLGIGIDAYTGAQIAEDPAGHTLGGVFGLYGVAVLDAGTYHAAETVQYTPLEDPTRAPVLSLRNVLVHLLAAGDFSYDLAARRSSLAAPEPTIVRSFETLRVPQAAGTLVLGGDLSDATPNDPVLARFKALAAARTSRLLIYADGYSSNNTARAAAETFARLLDLESEICTADDFNVCAPDQLAPTFRAADYSGIVLLGRDQSAVDVQALAAWLPALWRAGLPILADDAMAAVLGAFYAAHPPTPQSGPDAEAATQRSLRAGETTIRPGLTLVPATFEPQVLADNRWGRYFSLAYAHPDLLAVGLNAAAGLEIAPDGAWALGENVTFTLDLRRAALAEGAHRGFVVANALLDVFAPGDELRAEPANVERQPAAPAFLLHSQKTGA